MRKRPARTMMFFFITSMKMATCPAGSGRKNPARGKSRWSSRSRPPLWKLLNCWVTRVSLRRPTVRARDGMPGWQGTATRVAPDSAKPSANTIPAMTTVRALQVFRMIARTRMRRCVPMQANSPTSRRTFRQRSSEAVRPSPSWLPVLAKMTRRKCGPTGPRKPAG